MVSTGLRILIVSLAPVLAFCGEVNRSWDALMQSVKPGKTVVVTRMNSAQVEGKLLSISAESITVNWHKQPQVVQREDVYRVRIANRRRWQTLAGMAVGGGALAAIAGARSGDLGPAGTALGAGFGALVGAGVGALLPIGNPLFQREGRPQKPAKAKQE